MATVSRTKSAVDGRSATATWPAWTDQPIPYLPTNPDHWPAWTDEIRVDVPPAVPGLTAVEWLEGEVRRQQGLSRSNGDYHDYAGTILNDLLISFRLTRVQAATQLPAWPVLSALEVPESRGRAEAADVMDEIASEYLAMGGDLARLAAGALLAASNRLAFFDATSLEEFVERKAIWFNAVSDTGDLAADFDWTNPLW